MSVCECVREERNKIEWPKDLYVVIKFLITHQVFHSSLLMSHLMYTSDVVSQIALVQILPVLLIHTLQYLSDISTS